MVLLNDGTVGGQGELFGHITTQGGAYRVLDNGDADFSAPGWTTVSTGVGFDGDDAFAKPSYETGTVVSASWAFPGLQNGFYRVFASWPGGSTHTTQAPFTIFDNALLRDTAFVNQEAASAGGPNEFGFVFQQLGGTVSITTGRLRSTSNAVSEE